MRVHERKGCVKRGLGGHFEGVPGSPTGQWERRRPGRHPRQQCWWPERMHRDIAKEPLYRVYGVSKSLDGPHSGLIGYSAMPMHYAAGASLTLLVFGLARRLLRHRQVSLELLAQRQPPPQQLLELAAAQDLCRTSTAQPQPLSAARRYMYRFRSTTSRLCFSGVKMYAPPPAAGPSTPHTVPCRLAPILLETPNIVS